MKHGLIELVPLVEERLREAAAQQGMDEAEDVRAVQTLVRPLRIVWLTETDCQRALTVFTQHRLSHHMGLIDALISACALGVGATLCTFNQQDVLSAV